MNAEAFITDVNKTLDRLLAEASRHRSKRLKLLSFDYSLFKKDREIISADEETSLPDFVRNTLAVARARGLSCRVERDAVPVTENGVTVSYARQWTVYATLT